MSDDEIVEPEQAGGESSLLRNTKTPVYTAINAIRYQRQHLMREVEANGRQLLSYVAGRGALISRDDPVYLVDLLHNLEPNRPIDLLLHTPGGDVDAAEKLISLLRATAQDAELRVIVPDFAKSAGTMIALGADLIVMSDCSELGPIDPQLSRYDSDGNEIWHSVLNYLEAFDQHAAALRNNPDDPVAVIMLSKLDPTTLKKYQAVRDRARSFAEFQLKKKGLNYTKIAAELMDSRRWQSHGQMINYEAARSIGLPIAYLPMSDPEWTPYWNLYCLQRLAVSDGGQKLFESGRASLLVES